jgi:hypothetical protein
MSPKRSILSRTLEPEGVRWSLKSLDSKNGLLSQQFPRNTNASATSLQYSCLHSVASYSCLTEPPFSCYCIDWVYTRGLEKLIKLSHILYASLLISRIFFNVPSYLMIIEKNINKKKIKVTVSNLFGEDYYALFRVLFYFYHCIQCIFLYT